MRNHKILPLVIIVLTLFFSAPAAADDPPVPPFRIGGTLTVDSTLVGEQSQSMYIIMVSSLDQNLSPKCIIGVDTVGKGKGTYFIDIPLSDADAACWTAAGTTVAIHVYDAYGALNVSELKVGVGVGADPTSVSGSQYIIGNSGEWQEVNISATSPSGLGSIPASDMAAIIQSAISKRALEPFDVGGDGVIGLEEAIHALRILTGE